MTDMDIFEGRFARAYRRYLIDAPTQVDAAALAHSVAVARRPAGLAGWTWPVSRSRAAIWVALAAILAIALAGSLLAAAAWRPLERPFQILPSHGGLWMSRAVSSDELWTMGDDGGLWHYVGDAWQGPLSPPPLNGEMVSGLALGPDGALWVSSDTTVAVVRDGAWTLAWKAPVFKNLGGLVVAPDGTVWVSNGLTLVALRPDATGYAAQYVNCPRFIDRIAATTDGTVYVGGFLYSGGEGLARSDGVTCGFVDPLGDGQVHEVADLAAGPAGSLLATIFDENGVNGPYREWVVLLRDGRWSTISGPTVEPGISLGLAIAPDGQPWRIDSDLGLQRYQDGVWKVVAASAHSMAMAPDGVLWYETDGGIERIRTDEFGH